MLELDDEKVAQAANGNGEATEELLRTLVDDVHDLALRMLWHPIDAEDATEEILVEVVFQLRDLLAERTVRIGALRIAAQILLRTYQSPMERQDWTFEEMAEHLDRGISEQLPATVGTDVRPFLTEELKVGCTQTMLLCLDRPHRLAYVLADVFQLDAATAAYIVGIEPNLFVALLGGARERLHRFMHERCGVVNPAASCRCDRRLGRDLRTGRVNPRRLLFVGPAVPGHTSPPCRQVVSMQQVTGDPAQVFRSQGRHRAPPWIVETVCLSTRSRRTELLRA